MDKYDHAQVRPDFLSIVTPTFLAHCYRIEEYVYCSYISIAHNPIRQW